MSKVIDLDTMRPIDHLFDIQFYRQHDGTIWATLGDGGDDEFLQELFDGLETATEKTKKLADLMIKHSGDLKDLGRRIDAGEVDD